MKYVVLLLLLCSCASQHNSAKDPDVQLALKGISNNFQKLGLTPESIADRLNSTNFKVYLLPPRDMSCNWHGACTHIGKQEIVMELPLGGPWKECPRISELMYHELYHIALKFYQGFSDPVHIDLRWGLVEALMWNINPCGKNHER